MDFGPRVRRNLSEMEQIDQEQFIREISVGPVPMISPRSEGGEVIMDITSQFTKVSRPLCRICLSEYIDDEESNPLISPCHCSGTMKNVHI